MTWLVTGGAGYIGAHVVRAFRADGIGVVAIDDLSNGHREFVLDDVPFVRANLLDGAAVRRTVEEHQVTGVVHLAGFKFAGESVARPLHTYTQNVTAMVTLLDVLTDLGVRNFVFSGSAGVYGTPQVDLVTEQTPLHPESPYGETKVIGEWLLADAAVAHDLRYTSLRYFNVVGSSYDDVYDSSPHNLFPKVMKALTDGRTPQINGDDYPTPDGTPVKDHVHVGDLARAHVTAARALEEGRTLERVYNLGSGTGASVREIMDAVRRVTGIDFTPIIAPRRPGDPARIVASDALAARDLDWKNSYTIDEMVASAWRSWQKRVGAGVS
ncbi:MAG TPA: UDP-glucose 4-epimerase GalE [Kribbellaceae bacterium]|nr:UDP-glucose 4-epimerase GalE [Kribbellaceae bacterium]